MNLRSGVGRHDRRVRPAVRALGNFEHEAVARRGKSLSPAQCFAIGGTYLAATVRRGGSRTLNPTQSPPGPSLATR